jgi:hypothetical protein
MGLKDIRWVEDAYGGFMEFVSNETDKLILRLVPEFQIMWHARKDG